MSGARSVVSSLVLLLCSFQAGATGLLDAYRAATLHDPLLRAARYERDAGLEAPAISRAALLPNFSLFSSRSSNTGDRSFSNSVPSQSLDYRSSQDVLSLRQPLLNYEGYRRYQQGGVQVAFSEAQYRKKQTEMLLRVATAYFDVLLASEKLALAEAEIAAFGDQRTAAQRRSKAGEGTLIEIAETDARLAIAEANRADAADQVIVAQRTLEEMTGKPVGNVRRLKNDFVHPAIQPASLEEWLATAFEQNAEIIAQRRVWESSQLEVDRVRAQHIPRLDFVASYSKTENDSLNTLNQQANILSAGVQLTIPLFAGFGVIAQTRQANANRERAMAEVDAIVSRVQIEVRRWFMAVRTGAIKTSAYDRAVTAGTVSVDGTKRGMAAGVRTNTEVLDAQRLLFSVQRDRAQARYDLLTNVLKLKSAAGVLSEKDIAEIDAQLELPGQPSMGHAQRESESR